MNRNENFRLDDTFVSEYESIKPDFGFNGLGALTYYRTYSRRREDLGRNEHWFETVRRVVEGAYTLQKKHIMDNDLGWNDNKAQRSAQEMYDRMFTMKFLPPGRMLWAMGTDIVEKKGIGQALFNCAFVSTKDLNKSIDNAVKPFSFMMDMSMVGVGVGFDVKGAEVKFAPTIEKPGNKDSWEYVIPDTREGWVESLEWLLSSYLGHNFNIETGPVTFDYSKIRKAGLPIKGFGGTSSGPEPLKVMHEQIREVLDKRAEQEYNTITITDITDIMNMVGQCVVAGNVRRTAQIALGNPESEEFRKLKDYQWNSETNQYEGSNVRRSAFGWASNNSVFVDDHSDFSDLAEQTVVNGEPGYVFLDNIRSHSRMSEPADYKDHKVSGTNPCFTGDMKLLTEEGYKTFEELSGSELNLVNRYGEVVKGKVFKTGKREVVCIKAGSTKDPKIITCTPEHRFLVGEQEVKAKDLLHKRLTPFYKLKEEFKESFVKLGFIQGDASLRKANSPGRHTKPEVNFNRSKDSEVVELFNLVNPLDGRRKASVSDFSLEDLENMGFSMESLPNRSLPTSILKTEDEEILSNFMTGLFSANGSVISKTRVSLKSTCKDLITQTQNILEGLGIESYYTTNKGKTVSFGNGDYVCKDSYDLNISKLDSLLAFASKVSFVQQYKVDALKEAIEKKSPYVFSVKDVDLSTDVYDFSLYDDTHWGVVEGVVVHNCGEQSLESYELCCLIETFPSRAESYEDYMRTLKFAYLLGKTATLANTTWSEVNRVQKRNRRIGTSVSGVTNFIENNSLDTLKNWLRDGYDTIRGWDEVYSSWLCIPKSIKTTSVKPSGTVSLLAGVNPGCHFPEYKQYIRRMRLSKESDLIQYVESAGLHIEDDVVDSSSVVVSFPVKNEGRSINEVSIWEQVSLAVFLQKYWSDNQVSCTVTFTEEEASQIEPILEYFKYELKAISFLPKLEAGAYAQMPYEAISEERFEEMNEKVKPIDFMSIYEESKGEKFCSTNVCEVRDEMNKEK